MAIYCDRWQAIFISELRFDYLDHCSTIVIVMVIVIIIVIVIVIILILALIMVLIMA